MPLLNRIGVVSIYQNNGKKPTYSLRWYVSGIQEKLTIKNHDIALSKAIEINRDIGNGIYHDKSCYDPRKSLEKAKQDNQYKRLDYLFREWEKLDHGYAHTTLFTHRRIKQVLTLVNDDSLYLDNSHEFLKEYRKMYADGTIKRDIAVIIACVNYWVKLGKVPHNPYPVIKSQLKPKKQDNKGRFTSKERGHILTSFLDWDEESIYTTHYNFVKFLFLTGLRPEEVIPLNWNDLINGILTISKTYSKGELRHNTKQGKKDNIVHRKYVLNDEQENFLDDIFYESRPDEYDLIFPSPTGTYINWGNFIRRVWKPSLNKLVEQGKVRRYLKPYCMRHTYITSQIKKGTDLHIIAQKCGTSIEMITKTYLISNDWWVDGDVNLDKYDSYVKHYG